MLGSESLDELQYVQYDTDVTGTLNDIVYALNRMIKVITNIEMSMAYDIDLKQAIDSAERAVRVADVAMLDGSVMMGKLERFGREWEEIKAAKTGPTGPRGEAGLTGPTGPKGTVLDHPAFIEQQQKILDLEDRINELAEAVEDLEA